MKHASQRKRMSRKPCCKHKTVALPPPKHAASTPRYFLMSLNFANHSPSNIRLPWRLSDSASPTVSAHRSPTIKAKSSVVKTLPTTGLFNQLAPITIEPELLSSRAMSRRRLRFKNKCRVLETIRNAASHTSAEP